MGARQHADFADDRAHGLEIAAVDALGGVEDVPANDLAFEFLENAGDTLLVVFRFGPFGEEMCHHLLFHRANGDVAILLLGDRIGCAQILLDQTEHLLFERGIVGHDEVARLLRRPFRRAG